MATQEERHLAIVEALYEATGSGNWAAAEEHLTDDFYITEASTLPYAGVYRGRKALQDLYIKVMGMMDVAALEKRVHTTGEGHVMVLLDMVFANPAGTRATLVEMLRFRGDKVCEILPVYFDPAPVLAAIKAKTRKAG